MDHTCELYGRMKGKEKSYRVTKSLLLVYEAGKDMKG